MTISQLLEKYISSVILYKTHYFRHVFINTFKSNGVCYTNTCAYIH